MLKLSKHLYMSTITSLTKKDMLKIDVSPGEYELIPFEKGYVFTKTKKDLKNLDIVKIFADRDGDKGLSGTYYGGESEDPNQLRLYKTWLCKQYKDTDREPFVYHEYYEQEDIEDFRELVEAKKRALFKYDEYEARSFDFEQYNYYNFEAIVEGQFHDEERFKDNPKYIKSFNCYHNLPFLFYLNKEVSNFDNIHLEDTDQIGNCGYLWKVNEGEEHIGYVVQKKLHNMMGDQAGIGLFEGAVAFGNFDHNYYYIAGRDDDEHLEEARYGYQCCFDNCECDTQYEEIIKRNAGWKIKLAQMKKINEMKD